MSGGKPGKRKPREYRIVCCVCGVEFKVPVAPPPGRDLTCLNCLKARETASVASAP